MTKMRVIQGKSFNLNGVGVIRVLIVMERYILQVLWKLRN